MVKVRVRVFGTLNRAVPGYDPEKGLEMPMADGAKVKDLLVSLELSTGRGAVAASDGRILCPEDLLKDGMTVEVLQTVFGG
jgi:sulfur carrier protein ThiS